MLYIFKYQFYFTRCCRCLCLKSFCWDYCSFIYENSAWKRFQLYFPVQSERYFVNISRFLLSKKWKFLFTKRKIYIYKKEKYYFFENCGKNPKNFIARISFTFFRFSFLSRQFLSTTQKEIWKNFELFLF